jgi:hypothetical protein
VKLQPTPSEERWLALARRLHLSPQTAPFAGRAGGWRTANLWSRCAFFVLGLVAAVMISIIGSHLWSGAETLVAGLASVAVAEWLILGRRHFGSGLEEALDVVGLAMLAYECWSRVSTSEPIGVAFFGIALLIAGFRLLSPVFTTLSALAFALALDAPPLGAGLTCYAIGLIALVAGGYRFRRPSHDLMLDYLVIVMPVAGYLWSVSRSGLSMATDYRHAALSAWVVPLCPLLFAGIAVTVGLRRRAHSPVIAFMLCVACVAYELRRLTGLALEVRLIVWGCALLVASTILDRYLRVPHRGITSKSLREADHSIGVLGMVGSAVLTPHSEPMKGTPSFEGGGGRFGGGGAGGQY